MFKNFLLAVLRKLWRNKVNSLINITSLMLGLTVFCFAFLYVKQELSFDRSWPDAERIHRLVLEQRGIPGMPDGLFNTVVARAWPSITEYFADEIEAVTRLIKPSVRPADSQAQTVYNLALVDSSFSDIFQLEVVQGSMEQVLSGPGYIAIEESLAASWGESARPGERIRFASLLGTELEFEVAAIYRLPETVSPMVRFEMVSLIHDYALPLFRSPDTNMRFASWEDSTEVWLKLKPGVSSASFNALQPVFIQNTVTAYDQALGEGNPISEHLLYTWQPVTRMHFNPTSFETFVAGDTARVATFAVVGLLVLLVGCSNSVSLSLVSALERRREIGIRKAAGALPEDIMLQHLGEAVVLALLALIPALGLTHLLLPVIAKMAPRALLFTPITINMSGSLWMTLIALVTGLASGIYPALVLSGIRPEAVLKVSSGGSIRSGQNVRNVLVASQFCFALMLLIGTAALYTQLALTRSQPLGFTAENIMYISPNNQFGPSNGVALMNALEQIPGAKQVIPANFPPNMNLPLGSNTTEVSRNGDDISAARIAMVSVDADFFTLMDIPLLAGRFFDPARDERDYANETYSGESSASPLRFLLNRKATQALGFGRPEDAIDQMINRQFTIPQTGEVIVEPAVVVGVVEDNMFMSFSRRPGPELYMMTPRSQFYNLFLKYDAAAEADIKEKVQQVAQEINGSPLQSVIFVEDRVANAFTSEKNESRLLLICGGLALLLACIGLYGLAAFSMERKVKEVGVRKVLGSSVSGVISLFLWRFARPVLLASVLAAPVSVYFVLQWIEKFPYQLGKIWLLPLSAGATLVVLAIAMLTVSVITARAAMARPVLSLRYE